MKEATRDAIAKALENLASEELRNPEVWQQCYDLVRANGENELLAYVHDDLTHYSGEFHSHNVLGFRVKPNHSQLDNYRQEFRSIAAALRLDLSLVDAKRQFGL